MKFWISGEVMADVFDPFREVVNETEDRLNEIFRDRDYGSALGKLAFIAIIRPTGDDAYPELSKYHKRDKKVEVRLRIDHGTFRDGDHETRKRLLLEALQSASRRIEDLNIGVDHSHLIRDLQAVRL
jgi:hypothetical protein